MTLKGLCQKVAIFDRCYGGEEDVQDHEHDIARRVVPHLTAVDDPHLDRADPGEGEDPGDRFGTLECGEVVDTEALAEEQDDLDAEEDGGKGGYDAGFDVVAVEIVSMRVTGPEGGIKGRDSR